MMSEGNLSSKLKKAFEKCQRSEEEDSKSSEGEVHEVTSRRRENTKRNNQGERRNTSKRNYGYDQKLKNDIKQSIIIVLLKAVCKLLNLVLMPLNMLLKWTTGLSINTMAMYGYVVDVCTEALIKNNYTPRKYHILKGTTKEVKIKQSEEYENAAKTVSNNEEISRIRKQIDGFLTQEKQRGEIQLEEVSVNKECTNKKDKDNKRMRTNLTIARAEYTLFCLSKKYMSVMRIAKKTKMTIIVISIQDEEQDDHKEEEIIATIEKGQGIDIRFGETQEGDIFNVFVVNAGFTFMMTTVKVACNDTAHVYYTRNNSSIACSHQVDKSNTNTYEGTEVWIWQKKVKDEDITVIKAEIIAKLYVKEPTSRMRSVCGLLIKTVNRTPEGAFVMNAYHSCSQDIWKNLKRLKEVVIGCITSVVIMNGVYISFAEIIDRGSRNMALFNINL